MNRLPQSIELDELPNIRQVEKQKPPEVVDINVKRENTRTLLVWFLGGATILTISCTFATIAFTDKLEDEAVDVIEAIITSGGTLLGSALGFYFGNRNSD